VGVSTEIQWADSTVNPTMGCQGCELWGPERKTCYAGKSHERKHGKNLGFAARFEHVETRAGRMAKAAGWPDLSGLRRFEKPWLDGHPRLIFVSDMSDALSKGVAFEYLESEIVAAAISPAGRRHRWLWLTKLSPRMAEFSAWLARRGVEWPENLWAGTSITTQPAAKKRIEALLEVGTTNTVRFVSVEPQFGDVDLSPWVKRLDMVIQGGESGSKLQAAPFEVSWAREMRDACKKGGCAYFLKQLGRSPVGNGRPLALRDPHGGDWDEWPEDLRVRQLPLKD
jgi:protein gp37